MANIRVEITGVDKSKKEILRSVRSLSSRQVGDAAKETERVIREEIKRSLVRPNSSGKLANNFKAEKISDRSWGVGNIQILNNNVPYWRHINYGSEAIGADWQHRVPTGQFNPGSPRPSAGSERAGRWQTGAGNYSFVPKKAIEPHNFIQRTLAQFNIILSKVLRGDRL